MKYLCMISSIILSSYCIAMDKDDSNDMIICSVTYRGRSAKIEISNADAPGHKKTIPLPFFVGSGNKIGVWTMEVRERKEK